MKSFKGKYGVLVMVGGYRYTTDFGVTRKKAEETIRSMGRKDKSYHAMLIRIIEDVHIKA